MMNEDDNTYNDRRIKKIDNKSCSPVALGDELKVVLSQVLAPLGTRTLQTFS